MGSVGHRQWGPAEANKGSLSPRGQHISIFSHHTFKLSKETLPLVAQNWGAVSFWTLRGLGGKR